MVERFQIEDLVVQDTTGVLFRALDTVTGQIVALRRLFPFGINGGGLNSAEQAVYEATLERLATITHPALRSVVCGGCDPVDGMPYIATEWLEGTRLQAFLDRAPLGPVEAADLLTKALEVCELLSQVLGEEGAWVETDSRTIVVGADGTGRGVTFWISPLKWLGKTDGQRGLDSIVSLTEEIKGWHGKNPPPQAGTASGLGGWLKWLRGAARTATLHEARERLAAAVGTERPVPTKNLLRHAKSGKKKHRASLPLALTGCLVLTAAALGGWLAIQKSGATWAGPAAQLFPRPEILETRMVHPLSRDESEPIPGLSNAAELTSSVSIVPGETIEQRANRTMIELTASAHAATEEGDARLALQRPIIAGRQGVFSPADHELIMAQKGKLIIVEGVLEGIDLSQSGKTMYLLFSKNAGRSETRGSIVTGGAPADLTEVSLQPLVGKKIRLHGKVSVEKLLNRPTIVIQERKAIEAAE